MRNILQFILFVTVFSLKTFISLSQIIHIDKTDTSAYTKQAVWTGNVAAGIEIDKQSTTLIQVNNLGDLSLQKNKELFIFSGSNRITHADSLTFLNTGYLHLRWRHDYKGRLHPESFLQYQWDRDRGMVHRFVTGVNMRYNFWHKRAWEMTFATGLFYENELWDYSAVDSSKIPQNPVDQRSEKIRSNNYIKWEGKPSKNSNIAVIIFYQAPFADFIRPRISLSMNFSVDISKHFSLNLLYNGLYDAKPVVPIFKFYYSFSNNLVYKF